MCKKCIIYCCKDMRISIMNMKHIYLLWYLNIPALRNRYLLVKTTCYLPPPHQGPLYPPTPPLPLQPLTHTLRHLMIHNTNIQWPSLERGRRHLLTSQYYNCNNRKFGKPTLRVKKIHGAVFESITEGKCIQ